MSVRYDDGVGCASIAVHITVAKASGSSSDPGPIDPPTPPDQPDNPDPPDQPDPPDSDRFTDLAGYAWAADAINALADKGIIQGTSENTYSPGRNITRADFALLLTRAFGLTNTPDENFADVASGAYYAQELAIAKAAGIVQGIGKNKFNPEGEISREDMMLMLARALDAAGKDLAGADASVLAAFSDAAQISDYAREAVSRVVKQKIVAGDAGKINPKGKATRAEVAVVLGRIFL